LWQEGQYGSFRVMPACFVTGEAAGIAAAVAIKENKLPKEININVVQGLIKSQGGIL